MSDPSSREVTAEAEPWLQLEDLHAAYGQSTVLHGVSFSIDEGEVVSLIGRNGTGKTTTLRAILGVVDILSGSITYRGVDVKDEPPEQTVRRGIGLVPQQRRIFPDLTVRENLDLATIGGSEEGLALDIDDVFDLFGNLEDNERNHGSTLSGGEQQMLAIGRALVSGADLLLLDEPTEGLDPIVVERVVEAIEELNDMGLTILLVEQNVEVAMNIASRHYIMDKGEIVAQGTTDHMDENPQLLDNYLGVTT